VQGLQADTFGEWPELQYSEAVSSEGCPCPDDQGDNSTIMISAFLKLEVVYKSMEPLPWWQGSLFCSFAYRIYLA
jgi:hypothetical protein